MNDVRSYLESLTRPIHVVVTGGREYNDVARVRWALAGLHAKYRIARLAHGAARGADTLAGQVARGLGILVVEYPVDVAVDGPWPAAGCRRNVRMLEEEWHPGPLDLVVAFPGGRGTMGCVRTAMEMGIRVWRVT